MPNAWQDYATLIFTFYNESSIAETNLLFYSSSAYCKVAHFTNCSYLSPD